MRAAVNLVLAVEKGEAPDATSLATLRDAFLKIFGGKNPVSIFRHPLGLVPVKGRPKDYGFTPADIVSAYIELRRRSLANTRPRNALETAKQYAAIDFADFGQEDVERAVERDWKNGRATVEGLSDDDLEKIIAPYYI